MSKFRLRQPFILIAAILVLLLAAWSQRSPAHPTRANPANNAAAANLSSNSSMMALTANGRYLLAANPDSNTVSLIDTATAELLAEIPVGANPRSVAVRPDGTVAYVTNQDSDTLSVVDIAAGQVIATAAVGTRPAAIAAAPDGRFLAVAETGDDAIRFLDTITLATLSRHAVGDRPYGLAFTPDGRYLLITHLLAGSVTVLSVQPYSQFLPVVGNRYAVIGNQYALIDYRSPITDYRSPFTDYRSPFTDYRSPTTISTWPNVAPAPAVVVNSAGTRAYLPQTMANGLGLNTQFDTTVFPKVSVLNLETWQHQTSEHISLPETDQPVGLPWAAALAKSGTELWVANAGSNDVSVINVGDPAHPSRAAHVPVGDNPRAIVISPDGSTAYVNNTLAGTVSVIDTSTYTVTAVITTTTIPLPPLLLNGKRLFHSSARPELAQASWISCNTCHVEGEHDGRTWLLQFTGEPPTSTAAIAGTPTITRNTTSLLGMVETYPLRWSAEWDESADSEFSIRFEQFGDGLIDGEMHPTLGLPNQGRSYDLDCLAAFIDSLAIPERHHALTPAEQRGKAVFEAPQTGCISCHPPPLYTNLQQYDVGTADADGELFGPVIDTPTLRFLYDSAPYLHDGSAASLHDVLTTKNPGDQHGVTSHLTAAELADLVAFLLALPYQ